MKKNHLHITTSTHQHIGTSALSLLFLFAAIFLVSAINSSAQGRRNITKTPDEAYNEAISNPGFKESPNGEGFCWQARGAMGQFISNYESTKNTEWLDAGIKYYDWLVGKMLTDPDGYKGWIGHYDYDARYWTDALVGDALLLTGMLDFAVLVKESRKYGTDLQKKYKAKADFYFNLAKREFFEKWDHKKCWYDDYPFGSYLFPVNFLKPDNIKEWSYAPNIMDAGISNPFNMQSDAGELLLLMNKYSGDKKYWNRAQAIYLTAKYHFQYFDDHYCWNYWEPWAPGDVNVKKNTVGLWVGVHEWRSGYQASEVGRIVTAYHYGIVFDQQDTQRIINTNLKVMWNGDKKNPIFINSNGLGADHDTTGRASFRKAWGHSNEFHNAGELWTSLLDFDQTLRDISASRMRGDTTSERYLSYKKRMEANPPGFKRKHFDGEPKVPVVHFTECKDLDCAVVLPHNITDKQKSIIVCKSWKGGDLKIDLYSTRDKLLTNIYTGKIKDGFFMMEWDGKDPAGKAKLKGDYKVRWTINGGMREFPVVIH
jgi:hypothetical protein